MNELTDIKLIQGNWQNGEYKYNIQLLYNGVYTGRGKFARTYEDAKQYIMKELKEL